VIVQCPYCAVRYQLDTARLTGPNPRLKCSRCRRVFPAPSSKKPAAPSPSATAQPAPPSHENLTLPFEETSWKDEAEGLSEDDLLRLEPEDRFTLGTEPGEGLAFASEPVAPAAPPPAKPRARQTPPLGSQARPAVPQRRRGAPVPHTSERGKVRVILFFLGLVVAGYAVLARAFLVNPALTDRLLGKIPLIGVLGGDRLMVRKVALSDVTGAFQRIKDGKAVFVVTGKALNTAPVALHDVQIAAGLYDAGGREVDQKTIYCGNVISAKVLKDLTQRELSVLQTFSPPKRYMIEPGTTSAFVIVFMDPPTDAAGFTTKVVAAQRQT